MREALKRNVRLALRRFVRAPGFTAVAVVTTALGIGANVAIFSVVDTVLLEPLPYPEADELVAIWEWDRQADRRDNPVNPGNFSAWRERTASFESMSAVSLGRAFTLEVDGEAQELWGQYAHPDFFEVLGLEAALGRTFRTGQGAGDGAEIVLSHRHWMSRFGGDPQVVGRTVRLNGSPASVVGVLPSEYVIFGESSDVWASTPLDRGDQTNTGRWLMVLGRLADDTGFDVAAQELAAVGAGLREEFPDFNAGWDVNAVPIKTEVVGDVQRALWVLMGAVGLLLLIACANVANLLLVRATERQGEMAVRTSLGASGRALVGQLLTESLMLAGLGAVVGVVLGEAGTRAFARFLPQAFDLPRIEAIGTDGTVLLFAAAVTTLTALLFGLLPAAQALHAPPASTLNAESRGPSRRSGVVRNVLVVGEVAVSVALLAGAALFGLSFATLLSVDSGIQAERVLAGRVNLAGPGYSGNDAARTAFFGQLANRLEAHAGVDAAGGIGFLPMGGAGAATSYTRTDRPVPPPEDRPSADIMNVTGRYFATMGVPLLRGRLIDERDAADAPRAVVVSQALADAQFAGEDPLGKMLQIDWNGEEPWEIVGVVGDVRMEGLDDAISPAVYMTYAQSPAFSWHQIVVRTSGDPALLASVLRRELSALDPSVPLGSVQEMADIVALSTARPRMTAYLMGIFAALATLLTAVGLYGLLAHVVSQRVREIGVRIAIGAKPGDVVRMVITQGSGLAGIGLAVGVVIAIAGGRLVSGLLFGIEPTDPLAIGGAAVLLFAVAVLACALPAWRAARVAPASALRGE
jgi:putative ABC transport system permease protein